MNRTPIAALLLVGVTSPALAERTWSVTSTGNTSNLVSIWGGGRDRVFAAGSDGVILRSVDGGKSWNRVPARAASLVSIAGSGDGVYALGGSLVASADGGAT